MVGDYPPGLGDDIGAPTDSAMAESLRLLVRDLAEFMGWTETEALDYVQHQLVGVHPPLPKS